MSRRKCAPSKWIFSTGSAGGGLTGWHGCLNLSYMRATLTISLPPLLRRDVSRAAKKERVSESEFVRRAVKRQLWVEAFEETRRKAIPQARAAGIYTDEDVFKIVS
jgi:Arc/MetJ-type ribon-helix-helix transcriptional regulator